MKPVFRALIFSLLIGITACKSGQRAAENARIDQNGVMDITLSDLNKDAIRLKGQIVKSNGELEKRNSYDFKVVEVVDYGATFSSVEPKVGEVLNLMTPLKTSFEEGQVVILDVLTPRFKQSADNMRVRLGQP